MRLSSAKLSFSAHVTYCPALSRSQPKFPKFSANHSGADASSKSPRCPPRRLQALTAGWLLSFQMSLLAIWPEKWHGSATVTSLCLEKHSECDWNVTGKLIWCDRNVTGKRMSCDRNVTGKQLCRRRNVTGKLFRPVRKVAGKCILPDR